MSVSVSKAKIVNSLAEKVRSHGIQIEISLQSNAIENERQMLNKAPISYRDEKVGWIIYGNRGNMRNCSSNIVQLKFALHKRNQVKNIRNLK